MTASILFNEQTVANIKQLEDALTIESITKSITQENCIQKPINCQETEAEYNKILNMTNLALKVIANSNYKTKVCLEVSDIEQIKSSLVNFASKKDRINLLKKELIEDLTSFQKQIKAKHCEVFETLFTQKQKLERQIGVLNFEKHKLIMQRLSNIIWPYDSKTKAYDEQIEALQKQIEIVLKKLENYKQTSAAASEKDILLYQMHLKEKFAR